MDLTKVNHIITAVKGMLKPLVQNEIISGDEAKDLLTVLVLHAIRNDSIDFGGE